MRFRASCLLVLATLLPAAVDARPLTAPQEWLARVVAAAEEVSYRGELFHMTGGHRVTTMEVVRRGGEGGFHERLLTLDGVPSEVIRDGQTVTCILPEGRQSLAGQRVPRNPMPGQHWSVSATLVNHYEFLDLGEARVAGRASRMVGVRPLDANRYGYRLWVDRDTHLLLRADVIDASGETVERSAFTRIDIPATAADGALAPTLRGEVLTWHVTELDRGIARESIWQPTALPAGFVFDGARSRADGVEQQVFTDGLAMVSIFVGPVQEQAGLMGASRMGAMSAFGLRAAGRQVTVVGDLPEDTVRAIAESLRLGD